MSDYLTAHSKAILAAVGAVAVLIVDAETAQSIVAVAAAVLVFFVPNSQAAVARVYGPRA